MVVSKIVGLLALISTGQALQVQSDKKDFQNEMDALQPMLNKLMDGSSAVDSDEGVALYEQTLEKISQLQPKWRVLKTKTEKPKDKQTYGPKSLAQVKEMVEKFDNWYTTFEEMVTPKYAAAVRAYRSMKASAVENAKNAKEEAIKSQMAKEAEESRRKEQELRDATQAKKAEAKRQEELLKAVKSKEQQEKEERRSKWLSEEERLQTMSTDEMFTEFANSLLNDNKKMTVEELRTIIALLAKNLKDARVAPPGAEIHALRAYRIENKKLQKDIISIKGAWLALRAAGYRVVPREQMSEETKHVVQKMENQKPVPHKAEGSDLFLYLHEAPYQTADETALRHDWNNFDQHLKFCVEWLAALKEEVDRLGCKLGKAGQSSLAVDMIKSDQITQLYTDYKDMWMLMRDQ